MSIQTSGTLLPAAGGMIHAMHGGGGDGTIHTAGTLLPAAGGTIQAMHGGGDGTLLPLAGGTIHAMSGGDGGFVQTKTGNSMLPHVKAPIHPRSGGFKGGQRIITHLGESYTLEKPPIEPREKQKAGPYKKGSPEYKILESLGLEELYKLGDRDGLSGIQQEYDVLKAIYDGKCNLNSSLGSLTQCEPIRRVIHTLALELKTSLAFSMDIFDEADRAAANAAKSLKNAAEDKLASAMQQSEVEEEESSESKKLRQEEEDAKARLAALQREEEYRKARALASDLLAKDAEGENNDEEQVVNPLSEEDYARIAMASMIPSITIEETSEEGKLDSDKPEDPFQTAAISAVAAVHDSASIPVPIGSVEQEPELTEEDHAKIAIAAMTAMMVLNPTASFEKVEPPIDPATDPNGYIAQKKIKEAEATLRLAKEQSAIQSLTASLEDARKLAKIKLVQPVQNDPSGSVYSEDIKRLQHSNQERYDEAKQSIIESIQRMMEEKAKLIEDLKKKVNEAKEERENAESQYQTDENEVRSKLTTWMDTQYKQLETDLQDVWQNADAAMMGVDQAETGIALNNVSNLIQQSEKDKRTSWKPEWYIKWRDTKKIIQEYLARGGVHGAYAKTYLEKYKADADMVSIESKPEQLVTIAKGWGLNVQQPVLPVRVIDPMVEIIQKARKEADQAVIDMEKDSLDPDAVVRVVEEASQAAVQVIPPSQNVVEPQDPYEERIGEIGTIIDEKDKKDESFQPEAYALLRKTHKNGRTFMDERKAVDLLFERDETNPYYSSFKSKNSLYARTFMEQFYNSVYTEKHPDFQFIKDFPRTRNWTIHFPTDMLTAYQKMQIVGDRIPDDMQFKMKLYETWIQPVLKDKLTEDERAMFISFHQGLESVIPFVYSENRLDTYDNNGGAVKRNGYELFDMHTLTLNANTLSYKFIKTLYKSNSAIRMRDPEHYVPSIVLFSGTIEIDRKKYKQADDTSFIQFELFDFHNPFVNALSIQHVKSMALAVNEYLRKPYYSKMKRPDIHNSSPLKNINSANHEQYQRNLALYRTHLLSSLIDLVSSIRTESGRVNDNQYMQSNQEVFDKPIESLEPVLNNSQVFINKQLLAAIQEPLDIIKQYVNDISKDDAVLDAVGKIIASINTELKTIHDHFEYMVARAHSIAGYHWDKAVYNVYFDKGKKEDADSDDSLFGKQKQYLADLKAFSAELAVANKNYENVMSMDTLQQIIKKIEEFHLADRSAIFKTLSEWYDKRNIAKNYENRQTFHEDLLKVSKERFDIYCKYLDATMLYQELGSMYMILDKKRDSEQKGDNHSNDESPPPSPPPSPRSSSQTIPKTEALLQKLEQVSSDPSAGEIQQMVPAVKEIIVELDDDEAELARLEEELRKAEAEVERTKAVSKAARERANEARKIADAASESAASEPIASKSAASEPVASESVAIEPSASEPIENGSIKPRTKPSFVSELSNPNELSNVLSNKAANKASKRALAIQKLETKLAANKAAREAREIKVRSGTVPQIASEFESRSIHPNFLKTKALNDALAGVKVSTTQPSEPSEPSKPLEVVEESSESPAPRPSNTSNSVVPFKQQFNNEMAKQKKEQNEKEKLIQNELKRQGLSEEPISIPAISSSTEEIPLIHEEPAAPSINAPINVIPEEKPTLAGLERYVENAGMKPYVAPVVPVEPVQTTSVGPEMVGKKIQKLQNRYFNQLNMDPAMQRYREKQRRFAAENEAKKEKERNDALAGRRAVEAKEAEEAKAAKAKQVSLTSLQGAPNISKKISVMPAPKSAPQPPPEPKSSSNPSKMTKGMEQFMKREKEKQNAVKKAKQKKLEQIKLKIAMGQPLTANEKAIYRSQGGTRKKTKQSRKKIQTRKRSKRSTKRSTRTRK